MGQLYEKQEDGSLKPVEMPDFLVKRAEIYSRLRDRFSLSLEEINYLVTSFPNFDNKDKK